MYTRSGLILAATILSFVGLAGQEKGPTQAERLVVENPEVVNLALTPVTKRRRTGVYEKLSGPYKLGGRISFDLQGTNTSTFPLVVYGWDTFAQNRPLLFRNGQEVPYRKGLYEILKSKEKDAGMEIIHLVTTRLEPGQPTLIEKIDMNAWYEPLTPGSYELRLQHRFVRAGKWVDATPFTFEVELYTK